MDDHLTRGFYRLSMDERRERIRALAGLTHETAAALFGTAGLTAEHAELMTENAVGTFALPLGVLPRLVVNGRARTVPMATEEPSVVAAACAGAKLLAAGGGVTASGPSPLLTVQMLLLDVPDPATARARITAATDEVFSRAAAVTPRLTAAGGGPRTLAVRDLPASAADDPSGPMLVVSLTVDVQEAMGANAVTAMGEALLAWLATLAGGRPGVAILSNATPQRTVTATGRVPFAALAEDGGSGVGRARAMQEASVFAARDPDRAVTHNKGIMNGVDAVLLAAGQDTRAVAAAVYDHAARGRDGGSGLAPLSAWRVHDDGLHGTLTLPLPVGVVGGAVRTHPGAVAALALMGVSAARDLAQVAAAVGLAQNLAALRALVSGGLRRGHMRLHARHVAHQVGATAAEIPRVVSALAALDDFSPAAARAALRALRERPR